MRPSFVSVRPSFPRRRESSGVMPWIAPDLLDSRLRGSDGLSSG
jgi:hypothetical protein